jgi:hypothetical protein
MIQRFKFQNFAISVFQQLTLNVGLSSGRDFAMIGDSSGGDVGMTGPLLDPAMSA